MEAQRVDALTGMHNFLVSMPETLSGQHRKDALTTTIKGYWIDTCCAVDTRKWETAVEPDGETMLIVEQYPNKKSAETGHAKWVQLLTDQPGFPLKDIDLWGINALSGTE
jgi:hypothetical protein